jgi:hypothetical protein
MPARENIMVTKRDQDKFTVCTFSGDVYTWEMTTGKLVSFNQTGKDFAEFKFFGSDQKQGGDKVGSSFS